MGETSASTEERSSPVAQASRSDGVLQVARPETEWLHTGWNGGRIDADTAYNISVPEGWDPDNLERYVADRLANAGFESPGPALLTGVSMDHARGASCGPVTVFATAGVSNPAALPATPSGGDLPDTDGSTAADSGTVNLLVVTERALADGALANLVAVAAEAKAATLLDATGVPGTTTDAITVGYDPDGRDTAFSGSATIVGAATRAAVRDALRATVRSRYAEESVPTTVEEATYGVSTDVRASVFSIDGDGT